METSTDTNTAKYLVIILICIVIASVIAAFIYLYNSPKFMVSQITNNLGMSLSKYIEESQVYYDTEVEAHTTETNINVEIDEIGSSGVLKLSSNVNPNNEYNIYELKDKNENSIVNLYNNKDVTYIDLPNYEKFIKFESETLDTSYYKYSIDAFEKIFNELKKQLKDDDFYKLKINNEEGKSKNRIQVGIILSEKRYNEMMINALNILKTDNEFINDIDKIFDMTDQDDIAKMDKEDIVKKIDEIIDSLKQAETNDSSSVKISFVLSGILRNKIEKFEITSQENDNILFNISADINDNQLEANFEIKGKTYLYMKINKDAEGVYSINIKDNKEKPTIYDVNLGITGENSFVINGKILENKFSGEINLKTDSNKELNAITTNFEIGSIKLNSITTFTYEEVSKSIKMKDSQSYEEFMQSDEAYGFFEKFLMQIVQ